jgi:hypothetical protein
MKRSTPLTLLALASCAGEPRAPSSPPSGSGNGNATAAGMAGDDRGELDAERGASGGGGADVSGAGGGADAAPQSSAEFAIADVPSGPCRESSAPQRTLLAADAAGLTFDRGGRVADRYFAFDSASLAFVTFAADGGVPGDEPLASAPVYADVVALASDGAALRALEIDAAGKLVVSRFDAQGARLGASFELDGANTTDHALFAAGDRALAVWNVAGELRGRVLGSDGPQGSAFDFGTASCGEHSCHPIVLGAASHYVLVWGRALHDGIFAISFSAVDLDGTVLSTKQVLASRIGYRLVDAALLADESLALLIAEGFPSRGVLLEHLDAFGNVEGPAQRLLGAVEPWTVASHASTLAVVAQSTDDRALLRTFSSVEQASEDWICLDDNQAGAAFAPRAALFATGEGYGLVVRRMDGSSAFAATAPP